MAYYLLSFAGHSIPLLDADHDIGTGPAPAYLFPLPGGGSYDPKLTDQVLRPAYPVTAKGVYVAASESALATEYQTWRSYIGVRGSLIRYSGGGASHTATARVQEVRATRRPDYPFALQFEIEFVMVSPCWNGTHRNTLEYLDNSPKVISCPNAGDYPVSNTIITLTAAGSAITNILIGVSAQFEINWAGTLAATKSLVIDCGALSVKNDGVDAYSGFSRTANHKINEWLRMYVGYNNITVTRTGGNNSSAITFDYYDGWA